MATPILESSFTTGEVAPALFGNVQLARMHAAAATMRNFYVGYQGGAYSRAGTAYVGFSKQTGRNYPPRMVPFQFSINQGLALEFGNFYMRVIFQGGYVTEDPVTIIGISQANPGVLSLAPFSATAATANIGAVAASYVSGDTIALAGGAFTTRASLTVINTRLASISLNAPGILYTPGEIINLSGGTFSTQPTLKVASTQVINAAISNAGTGGAVGPQTVTGTTGTGTKFQAAVTVNGAGHIAQVDFISLGGDYTVNPNQLDPVTGGGLVGAVLDIRLGVKSVTILNAGVFSVNSATFTQAFSSGSGSGATFNAALFGPNNLSVSVAGNYTVPPANPVAQFATSGAGAGATYNVTFSAPPDATGDWAFLTGIGGMTQLNGRTVVLTQLTSSTYSMADVYGGSIDTTAYSAYTSGGTAARIFTLQTPYAEQDLKWLKLTESADVMSLCCVNQETGTEYAPLDLSRISDTSWVFTPAVPAPTVSPPASVSGATSSAGSWDYQYVVTAVSPVDGSESVASPILEINAAVDIATTAGTLTVTWTKVGGVNQYNVYKASPGLSVKPPAGSLFGFAGMAYGTQFLDSNIVQDFTQVPPLHKNPFARGQIITATPTAGGAGYTFVTFTVTTSTGSGAIFEGVIVGGALVAVITKDNGHDYAPGDTVSVSGDGAGATAALVIGAQTGTYPGVVAYFQQRRAYAYTLNQPDTYFLSQPGSFTNFDSRAPTIDSDAITGTPWSVQVNGIQFMITVAGGLMVLTGLEAYFLTGAGGSAFSPQPLTPASQSAQPQGFNGCSPTVPPIRIYNDVLYVQAKGATYRDFAFQIAQNNYTGDDITQNSTQLFNGHTIKEHAWCEEPYRVLWAVRDDGIMLSLTFVKPEKVQGWARHDTNGTFESVCSVTEPPVDALYVAVKRNIGVHTAYVVERMNDRLWSTVEDAWCVDCGFSLPRDEPAATISASSATGLGSLTGVTALVGGTGYSAGTTATVVDDNGEGPGSGATVTLTIVAGVITAIAFPAPGTGYVRPALVIVDPAGSDGGSGASARVTLNNASTFTTDAAAFVIGDVGRVLRMGGGVATITAFTNSQSVTANISSPIATVQPDVTGADQVQPQVAGTWSLSTPITVVAGLQPMIGATVTGLADGVKIAPQVVSAAGTITLPTAASQITVGLGYQAQLQSVYLDAGEPTVQGQRGVIPAATARIEASGPFLMGSNQPDGSTLSPVRVAPPWRNMQVAPVTTIAPYNSVTVPLCTNDIRIPINQGYSKHKQVCVQQSDPYPLNVLAFIPEVLAGDKPSQAAPERQKGGRG